jgi:general secretion pathway protein M
VNDLVTRAREWFEKLAPRERRLMSIFLLTLAIVLLLAVPAGASLVLASRRTANRELREAIHAIKNSRDEVRQRQARREAVIARYATRAPPLAGMLEKAARDNNLDVPESQDRPEIPHGKRYVERSTVVRLRKSGMLQLARVLEQIEQQRMPIAITRLNVRRRGGERDSYDVELGVSAFDRSDSKDPTAAGGPK